MRVTFDPAASEDLDRIFEWIAKSNRVAAFEMIGRIGCSDVGHPRVGRH
jgi:plasmid stabilization system protein ParE